MTTFHTFEEMAAHLKTKLKGQPPTVEYKPFPFTMPDPPQDSVHYELCDKLSPEATQGVK